MITIMNEPWPGLVSQQIICANTDLDFAILSHIFLFLDGGDYLFLPHITVIFYGYLL